MEALQRGMVSYLEHCQHFGRTHDFVVIDDSMSTICNEYSEMLRSLKQRYGMSIAYAGFEEKMTYAKKLSEVGNIRLEVMSGHAG